MTRYVWFIVVGMLGSRVQATLPPPVIELRLVSVVAGCLEVGTGATVVMTENFRDAWFGYVQEPGKPRQVRWSSGMFASRIPSGSASVKTPAGDEIKYAAVSNNGKVGFVARRGMVEFAIDGDTESDLQYLLSVAQRLRTDVPRDACERPQSGKPAF